MFVLAFGETYKIRKAKAETTTSFLCQTMLRSQTTRAGRRISERSSRMSTVPMTPQNATCRSQRSASLPSPIGRTML